MINRFASTLLILVTFNVTQIAICQQHKRFDPKSYPTSSFHVSSRDYPFGTYTVRIIQAKRIYEIDAPPPSYCRAWLEVRGNGNVLRQAYFDDIEPVGSYYGIFLPEHQPLTDYFLALKEGDYDGTFLIVGKDGTLDSFPGGDAFLTTDKRFLIGSHDSDYESVFVIDLTRRQLSIDGAKEKLPSVGDWYLDQVGYFFTEDEEDTQPHTSNPKTLAIYRLDLKRMKITKSVIDRSKLKSSRKMQYEKWQKSFDCGVFQAR